MKKLLSGLTFLMISAVFYSANVIVTNISELVETIGGHSEVGHSLIILSIIFFILAVIFLAMFEHELKYTNKQQ
ncbi:hypothetical protein [Ornithinibacillus sp. FSL M8-0202]|uniref:hypothetical protein n=1 Tax=Ornithinibacillus sp. FSL M8-0202 TaxID=2921616 RepID=UPI0030CB674E